MGSSFTCPLVSRAVGRPRELYDLIVRPREPEGDRQEGMNLIIPLLLSKIIR